MPSPTQAFFSLILHLPPAIFILIEGALTVRFTTTALGGDRCGEGNRRMKAIRIEGLGNPAEVLKPVDIPDAVGPAAGEAVIEVEAAPINQIHRRNTRED